MPNALNVWQRVHTHKTPMLAATVGLAIFLILWRLFATHHPYPMVLLLFFLSLAGPLYFYYRRAGLKQLCRLLLRIIYRVEVDGLANYVLAGPKTLIIANYASKMDLLLLSVFLPDRLTVAVQNKPLSLSQFLLFFVKRIDVEPMSKIATRRLVAALKNNERCIVFPHKTFGVHGVRLSTYEGPGFIVDKAKASVLPIYIEGSEKLPFAKKGNDAVTSWFPKIRFHIQLPVSIKPPDELSARERRHYLALNMYTAMRGVHFKSQPIKRTMFRALLDAKKKSGRKFVICEDIQKQPLTYQQFVLRAFILGAEIAKVTNRGEHVGILMPTTCTGMVTFYAMQAYARVPAMLNFSLGSASLLSACKTATIKRVYTSEQFVQTAKIENIIDALKKAGIVVVYLESFKEIITLKHKMWGMFKTCFAKTIYQLYTLKIKFYHPAVVLFTSGSEGAPKGVVLSHQNLLANCAQIAASVDFTNKDKLFNALPIFHCFGLTAGALLPLSYGIPCFFYPSPLHYRIIPNLVEQTHATIMFGTDTFLSGYARYAVAANFQRIRYIFAGAEKVKAETVKYWSSNLNVQLLEGYGATEAAPVISINTLMQYKNNSVGCLCSGIEYRLIPVQGIKDGGRLHIKGPNVMMGYLMPEEPGVLKPLNDGWHDTGDIVHVDREGFVTILGRAKRFAKIGGEMVSLTAVESIASKMWPESLHAVVSLADIKKGEQLLLLSEEKKANKNDFIAYIKEHGLSELYVPKHLEVLTQIPVLATGKIDYVEINKKAMEYIL